MDPRFAARRLGIQLGVTFKPIRVEGHSGCVAELGSHAEMLEKARPLAVEMEKSGSVLLVGARADDGPHRLYLLPVGSLETIRLFRVGTHNAPDDAWREVEASLQRIHREAPFSVYFADEAGYKAAFAGEVDVATAKRFEEIILQINIEALALGPVWKKIRKEGMFELWWD